MFTQKLFPGIWLHEQKHKKYNITIRGKVFNNFFVKRLKRINNSMQIYLITFANKFYNKHYQRSIEIISVVRDELVIRKFQSAQLYIQLHISNILEYDIL